jgi:hypothetical protein
MNAELLARAICLADGKNPDKLYKKRPLYTYSVEYAIDIISHLPVEKPIVKAPGHVNISYDEKLKIGVQAYIDSFNSRCHYHDRYVNVSEMPEPIYNLHKNSLKAAIKEMLK